MLFTCNQITEMLFFNENYAFPPIQFGVIWGEFYFRRTRITKINRGRKGEGRLIEVLRCSRAVLVPTGSAHVQTLL